MRRTLILLLMAALTLSACHRGSTTSDEEMRTPLTMRHVAAERHYEVLLHYNWNDTTDICGINNSIDIVWPDNMPLEAQRELLFKLFGDTLDDFDQACEAALSTNWFDDEDNMTILDMRQTETANNEVFSNYHVVQCDMTNDDELFAFNIYREDYFAYAVHPMHYDRWFTYDNETQRVVHLEDLIDTAQLRPVIVRALFDLPVNQETKECVYDLMSAIGDDEFLTLPDDFFIDSTRSTIVLVYQPYEIACYACGVQYITLPIFWLSKHLELTPYAKRLFGPTAYLKES